MLNLILKYCVMFYIVGILCKYNYGVFNYEIDY